MITLLNIWQKLVNPLSLRLKQYLQLENAFLNYLNHSVNDERYGIVISMRTGEVHF